MIDVIAVIPIIDIVVVFAIIVVLYCYLFIGTFKFIFSIHFSLENHPNQTIVAVLECSEGFYREKSSILCTPSCYTWLQYRKGLSTFLDVVLIIAALVGVISAVAVIVISFMRRKRM